MGIFALNCRQRMAMTIGVIVALSVGAIGCGNINWESSEEYKENPIGRGIEGSVMVAGSAVVEPISVRVAEYFEELEPKVSVTVDGTTSGDGFKQFCAAEIDISGASRRISEAEADICEEAGVEWIELLVAFDGIVILLTGVDNPLDCVSFGDIYGLVGAESTGFESWLDAATLGVGTSNLPDAELSVHGHIERSDTYDSLIKIVLADIAEERNQIPMIRSDYTAHSDVNILIREVGASYGNFGWTSLSGLVLAANSSNIKTLKVDGGSGCVSPTVENIVSAEYPAARPLYIYVNAESANSSAVNAYVNFYLSEFGLVGSVSDVGHTILLSDLKKFVRNLWLSSSTHARQ